VITSENRMFKHILFPVDFSERCKQAIPFVKAFAKRHGAAISLMHVIHVPAGCYGGMDGVYSGLFDSSELESDARLQLTDFCGKMEAPASVAGCHVVCGDPGQEIVAYAAEKQMDLIMMPTAGHGKFRRFLLGSVTAQVLHDAHCPVWTNPHVEQAEHGLHVECQCILCAIGRNETSLPVMQCAKELAKESGASVYMVHAVPGGLTPGDPFEAENRRLMAESLQGVRKRIDELQHAAGTDWRVNVKAGGVSDVVRESAEEQGADLVVSGRGRLPEWLGGLRTHAYAVIRDSPCPVLSV
jgi:nucleotide-binding universal stress UspA family protein